MTNAPSDLVIFRNSFMGITGLTNPVDVGIVGDGAHQRTGGYHEGKDVLISIGRYHGPASANVGSTGEDYSARLSRDRSGLTNNASAVDLGDDWPKGGRAAWVRFNNLLAGSLPGDNRLAAIRAINYSPDGTSKRRIDRQAGWTVQATTDSVTMHTHVEFYRDTDGKRAATLARLNELAEVAIYGEKVTDMDQNEKLIADTGLAAGRTIGQYFGDGQNLRNSHYATPAQLIAAADAIAAGHKPAPLPSGEVLVNPPPVGSVDYLLAKFLLSPPAPVLSDAQIKAIADQVSAAVIDALPDTGLTQADVQEAMREVLPDIRLNAVAT